MSLYFSNKKNMIAVLTEHNRWENEKWHYVLSLEKQDCECVNLLMSFISIANKKFEEVASDMRGSICFAASSYSLKFYDSVGVGEEGVVLVNSKTQLRCRRHSGYTSNYWSGNLVLSYRKIKSARDKIRDKGDNILYKNFTYCCYAKSLSENINS